MDVHAVIKAFYQALKITEPDSDKIQQLKDEIELLGTALCCQSGPITLQVVMSDPTCLINNVVWSLKSDVGTLETHEFSTETDYLSRFKTFVESLFCAQRITKENIFLELSH